MKTQPMTITTIIAVTSALAVLVFLPGCTGGPNGTQIAADLVSKGLCKSGASVSKQSATSMGGGTRVIATVSCEAKVMVDPLGESCHNIMGCWGWRKVSDTCTLDYSGSSLGSVSCGQIGRW